MKSMEMKRTWRWFPAGRGRKEAMEATGVTGATQRMVGTEETTQRTEVDWSVPLTTDWYFHQSCTSAIRPLIWRSYLFHSERNYHQLTTFSHDPIHSLLKNRDLSWDSVGFLWFFPPSILSETTTGWLFSFEAFNTLRLLYDCSMTALWLLWDCPEIALRLLWNWSIKKSAVRRGVWRGSNGEELSQDRGSTRY